MTSQEILEKYLNFYGSKGHKQIPNVSLVPENDPTLLFVNSGVFPLVPYVFGEEHPLGNRLMNVQRCVRFEDLENVGISNRHTVAFHMIGNWSLGDYFKKEQLYWIWEYFVEYLELDINKLYATVFAGDADAPKDERSIQIIKEIYKKYGIDDAKEGKQIFAYGKKDNWWKRGDAIGEPGGPSSEIYYYIGKEGTGLGLDPAENEDTFIEIGNSVFMQYKKTQSGWAELKQKNVDFGGGLERIALAVQGKQDIFETDNFLPIIQKVEEISGKKYGDNEQITKEMRILADHVRSAVFMAMDGVLPSNKDQGYMLRRVLRRMVRAGRNLEVNEDISVSLVQSVISTFSWLYPELIEKQTEIEVVFSKEEEKFRNVLTKGSKEAYKILKDSDGDENELAKVAFDLYQSLGYPTEMFVEDIIEIGLTQADLNKVTELVDGKIEKHKQKSRSGAEQKFSGGLADKGTQTVKYHTATHLLHWALREVLGETATQQGSNITGERLRFDFSFDRKLNKDEISQVQDLVNQKVAEKIPVNFEVMDKNAAIEAGALHFFKEKYGEKVKVYFIGNNLDKAISKEFCGGPHVANTQEIGKMEIYKQDKIGKGVMRIYARNTTK